MLDAEITIPYENACPMVRMCSLAKCLNNLQKYGYEIAIISWLSKCGSNEYNEAVAEAKKTWLAKHLPSVAWDEIIITPYGTPKEIAAILLMIFCLMMSRRIEKIGLAKHLPKPQFLKY